jgi:hypothetical protein
MDPRHRRGHAEKAEMAEEHSANFGTNPTRQVLTVAAPMHSEMV